MSGLTLYTRQSLSTHVNLGVGDSVWVEASQNSGGGMQLQEARFGMVKVP